MLKIKNKPLEFFYITHGGQKPLKKQKDLKKSKIMMNHKPTSFVDLENQTLGTLFFRTYGNCFVLDDLATIKVNNAMSTKIDLL